MVKTCLTTSVDDESYPPEAKLNILTRLFGICGINPTFFLF